MPKIPLNVTCILFDLDGTLVNSTPAVEKSWAEMCEERNRKYPNLQQLNITEFLHNSHGSRTTETFAKFFPDHAADPNGVEKFEKFIVDKYGHLAKEVPGTSTLLSQLHSKNIKWAVVTSGTVPLAHGWFKTILKDTDMPDVFVTANDVTKGKPDPQGYLMAAKRLGEEGKSKDSQVYVFEDAPVGVKAGVQAGFTVIGIATTFDKQVLIDAGATYVIQDMTNVVVKDKAIEIDTL